MAIDWSMMVGKVIEAINWEAMLANLANSIIALATLALACVVWHPLGESNPSNWVL